MPDRVSIDSIKNKNAKIIACALGENIKDPRRVQLALEAFKGNVVGAGTAYRQTERELRAYALRAVIPDPWALFPEDPADLKWSDVHWPEREKAWAILMRDIGAPTEPDPAIVAAWSQTTFLPRKPLPAELTGQVIPGSRPFAAAHTT
jgi:hypothetical protein